LKASAKMADQIILNIESKIKLFFNKFNKLYDHLNETVNDTKLKAKDRKEELIKSFEVMKQLFSEQNKLLIETNNKYKQNQNNHEIQAK
jgi:hypothetical protein